MNKRPLGVTLAAILTLLNSVAFFSLFVFYMLLAAVGGPHTVDWLYWIWVNPAIIVSAFLSAYAFSLSISMFIRKTKHVWYASILFWLATLVFSSWRVYSIWKNIGLSYNEDGGSTWQLGTIIVTMLLLAYSIGCLIYFQTARVKDYFNIRILNTLNSTENANKPSKKRGLNSTQHGFLQQPPFLLVTSNGNSSLLVAFDCFPE